MTDAQRLWLVRALHSTIYLLMVGCILAILYAGVTGAHGRWLSGVLILVGAECLVFVASGWRCPLTAVAVKFGAVHGKVYDTFLPEQITRRTLQVFGPLIGVGVALLAARWLWLGWPGG